MSTVIGAIEMIEFIVGVFVGGIISTVGTCLARMAKDENSS